MHELSIANSILQIARSATPPQCVLRAVRLIAGPMRAIEPEAMQFAWRAVIEAAGLDEVALHLDLLPWTLRCPDCGQQWEGAELDARCATCGANRVFPVGGDELQVMSIEVDDEADCKGAISCEPSLLSKT